MDINMLATPCLLYCGSCAYYLTQECKGCGTEDRSECSILNCCRKDHELSFCTECANFPCDKIRNSIGIHPKWLDVQAIILKKVG